MTDWNPDAYARFRALRVRPALDLLAHVGDLPPGDIVDLGCGDGAIAADLAQRFAGRRLIGVDQSDTMLGEARARGLYHRVDQADAGQWQPRDETALIFSNAVLHWVPDHTTLLPRLAGALVPGGVLAVQMPRQFKAPSHRFLRDIAASLFPDRFDFAGYEPPVSSSETYVAMLSPFGAVDAWETDYVQRLDPSSDGHPVRRFTESTAMRPFLNKLSQTEATAFFAAYEAALTAAYPLQADGSVLFPFRRCFFVLKV